MRSDGLIFISFYYIRIVLCKGYLSTIFHDSVCNYLYVTTNLPFSNWTDLFENTTMVAALIDRLTFRSHVLDMKGDSYRLKATMQNKA